MHTHLDPPGAGGRGPCVPAAPSLQQAGWPGEGCGRGLGRRDAGPGGVGLDQNGPTWCNGAHSNVVLSQVSGDGEGHPNYGPFAG